MNISVNRLLEKISDELTEAKRAGSEAKIRERAQAIKALCELILDESVSDKKMETAGVSQPVQPFVPQITPQVVPQVFPQQGRLKMDDEANGDSIFDF